MRFQLPTELIAELVNAFPFDFRWSVLRNSSSILFHFLVKRERAFLQNVDVRIRQLLNSYQQLGRWDNNEIALPMLRDVPIHEAALGARALNSFHTGNVEELFAILEGHKFGSEQIQPVLHLLWWQTHYTEAEQIRGRPLGAVGKYRVRRRHPLPRTIWTGKRTDFCFREETSKILREHYLTDPDPSPAVKQQLAQERCLTEKQVNKWFKKRRLRDKLQQQQMSELSPLCPVTNSSSGGLSCPDDHPCSSAKVPPVEFKKKDGPLGPKEKKQKKDE
ncbi:hypothetical protein niasHT_034134 [Heterodera trifolii]|uniref:Homeobox domain-containing protein n=1 Tax=Heterodera trifolii TaxID=157864 RepID=A0ABD2J1F1_9BILA